MKNRRMMSLRMRNYPTMIRLMTILRTMNFRMRNYPTMIRLMTNLRTMNCSTMNCRMTTHRTGNLPLQ